MRRDKLCSAGGTTPACIRTSSICSLRLRDVSMYFCRRDPNEPASAEQLRKLGVLSWQLDADNHEDDPKLKAIRAERHYSYQVGGSSAMAMPLAALTNCLFTC